MDTIYSVGKKVKQVCDGYTINLTNETHPPKGLVHLIATLFALAGLPKNIPYVIGVMVVAGRAIRAVKGVSNFRAEKNGSIVRFICQPGNNTTARELSLNVPKSAGLTAEALVTSFTEAAERLGEEETATSEEESPKMPAVPQPVTPTRAEVLAKEEAALQEEEARLTAKLAEAGELLEPADLQLTHEEAKLERLKRELTSLQAKITSCENEVERLRRDREAAHELAGKAKIDLEKCQGRLNTVGAEKRRLMIEELDAQVRKSGATPIDYEVLATYFAQKAADAKKS